MEDALKYRLQVAEPSFSSPERLLPQIKTKEATKNALSMTFMNLLGYDIFNPSEVNLEFIADIYITKWQRSIMRS